MNYELLPFQKEVAAFMYKRGSAINGCDVGLGKTFTTLNVIEALPDCKQILILCPAILKYQWQAEIEKFYPGTKTVVVTGNKKERNNIWEDVRLGAWKYVIANYELLLKDFPLMDDMWDAIIADECTYISSATAKRSKLIKKLKAKHRFALTGTLISNRAEEVWNVVDFISPGAFGKYWNFLWRYTLKNQWGGIYAYKNLPELNQKLQAYFIRKTKEEVLLELPDKIVSDIPVELSEGELKLYNQIKKEVLFDIQKDWINKVDDPTTMALGVVKLTRLRQACNSMELLGSKVNSSKMEALKTILLSLKDRKVIIFSEFAEMCEIIFREVLDLDLKGTYSKITPHKMAFRPLIITGDTPAEDRQSIIELFNRPEDDPKHGNCNVLVMSSAGKYGLNLQAASVIIHFDLPWSLASIIQREGRAHRMGQKENVLVYRLIGKKTVDEYIAKKLIKKQVLSDRVLIGDLLKELV